MEIKRFFFVCFLVCSLSCQINGVSQTKDENIDPPKTFRAESDVSDHTTPSISLDQAVTKDKAPNDTKGDNHVSENGKNGEVVSNTDNEPKDSTKATEPAKTTDTPKSANGSSTISPSTTVPVTPGPNTHETTKSTITTPTVIPPTNATTVTTPTIPSSTMAPTPTKEPPLPNSTEHPATPASTTPKSRFDGPSFVGGIVLTVGLVAMGFIGFKYYKTRTDSYHTL